jgi:CBS domain containing-hemolysin-like protein
VVVDEFGGNVGIVTLQHVVAEIIGRSADCKELLERAINAFCEIENTFSSPSGASGSDYYNT